MWSFTFEDLESLTGGRLRLLANIVLMDVSDEQISVFLSVSHPSL